jgi:hypothetical protein
MNSLCESCVYDCKEDPQKLSPDGSDCRSWVPDKEWLNEINKKNPYWWVE